MKLLKEMKRRRKRILKKVGPLKYAGLSFLSAIIAIFISLTLFSKFYPAIMTRIIATIYGYLLYFLIFYKYVYVILFNKSKKKKEDTYLYKIHGIKISHDM